MKKIVFLILSLLTVLLAGCASTRQSQFYILSPAATPPVKASPAKFSVAVGPVTVPASVDRPQIVLKTGPNEVFISEFDRWASPLKGDIARVVAENLVSLLGTKQIYVFPQSAVSDASYHVMIDFFNFESDPRRAATLDALWMIVYGNDKQVRSRTTITEPVQGNGYAELVAAHSLALGRLSAEIAIEIRRLEGN
ncbi:MAG: PqiC family protein [Smithella sp.]